MVLWLYSAEQYKASTPINEIAEHAALHGFNDDEVEVLCLHGHEFFAAEDLAALRARNFTVRDVAPLYRSVAARYPNLRRLYPNHFFECFLRWIVLKEHCRGEPILAWDADIFFNDKLSRVQAALAGSTFTASSTCFAALHDPAWLDVYEERLDRFEAAPAAYAEAVRAELDLLRRGGGYRPGGSFFGDRAAGVLPQPEAWRKLFDSTPEEMFVDHLARQGILPHHVARPPVPYVLAAQPLLLPQLSWTHPLGPGLAPADVSGEEELEVRAGAYFFGGRRLAFLHFQGAVFRACAVHQILRRHLADPAKMHDEVYTPAGRRAGLSTNELFFARRRELQARLEATGRLAALRREWGDPFSERAVARAVLLKTNDLAAALADCGVAAKPAEGARRPGGADSPAPAPQDAAPGGRILALTHDPRHPLFTSWLAQAGLPVEFVTEAGIDHAFPPDTALVVSADCYNEPRVSLLRRAVEQGIPTLLLADGILEYRNTWEHPQLTPGSIYQPVMGHKVACIGRSQVRILESWGNAGRCELVGSPRFDRYAGLARRRREPAAPFRVLVMTAITPYFTEAQHERVRRSLLDLKEELARAPWVGDIALEPVWRLTKGLEKEIGVESAVSDLTGRELGDVLRNVDAVVTTPSTSMLEAMLLGLPVAVLDYTNSPLYVQPAWRIAAAEHIRPVLADLVHPPAARMLLQDTTLHDALECATPAAPRMQELARRMIAAGREARRSGQPLRLPARILEAEASPPVAREERFRLADLYPGQPTFEEHDVRALQVEVVHLRRALAQGAGATPAAEPPALTPYAQATIQWRSKLEAALALTALGQARAAVKLMLEGIKSVESCKDPRVILEALIEIATHLAPLDRSRARHLLGLALQVTERLGNRPAGDRVRRLLARVSEEEPVAAMR